MKTRKRRPLTALYRIVMYVDNGGPCGLRLSCPSEPVSVYDWFKNGFVTHEVNVEAAYTPNLAGYG